MHTRNKETRKAGKNTETEEQKSPPTYLLFFDAPVEHEVVLEAPALEGGAKQPAKVRVIGRLVERQPAAVLQIQAELVWKQAGKT